MGSSNCNSKSVWHTRSIGSNGVPVVEKTTGRNAGKIITPWRH